MGLGLVVREWYWPIPWTTRSRFQIYFSIFCISRGFRVVDGKYEKPGGIIKTNNEPAIRRDLPSLTSARQQKREAGTSPVVAYERASDWIKSSARLNKAYERLDLSDRVKRLVLKSRKTLNLQACFVG